MLNDRRVAVRTPAEALRETLTRIEARMGQLDHSSCEELLLLLPLLDEAFELLSSLQERGVAIPAEQARFVAISQKFKRNAGKILRLIGGPQNLAEARREHMPPDSHWWWFLETWVSERQRILWRRILLRVGIGVAIFATLSALYALFLAPEKSVRMALRYENEAEAACESGDYVAASRAVESALAYRPDSVDLHVFAGILQELLAQPARAEETFSLAQGLAENREAFLLSRARRYLALSLPKMALSDAEAILADNEASGYGYYVKGLCHEQLLDWQAADAAYVKAETLAAASGNAELQALARVQRAYMAQMMFSAPTEGASESGD
ncbi:MAG: hypothetical protein JXA21_28635 [Anaerolineae bacterium]|nr:hypothetical protein [Anaerolineae bacterium]